MRVNWLGFEGWGKIGPGCGNLMFCSPMIFKIVFPGTGWVPGVVGDEEGADDRLVVLSAGVRVKAAVLGPGGEVRGRVWEA